MYISLFLSLLFSNFFIIFLIAVLKSDINRYISPNTVDLAHLHTYPWRIYCAIVSRGNIIPAATQTLASLPQKLKPQKPHHRGRPRPPALGRQGGLRGHTAQVRLQAVPADYVHSLAHLDLPRLVAPLQHLLFLLASLIYFLSFVNFLIFNFLRLSNLSVPSLWLFKLFFAP